ATANFTTQQTFATGSTPQGVAAGDFNGDGKPDLAVADWNSDAVSVLLNTTAAGATTPTFNTHKEFTAGNMAKGVVVADFNGDGKPDLAVANANVLPAGSAASVSVFLDTTPTNASIPSFSAQQTFAVGIDAPG